LSKVSDADVAARLLADVESVRQRHKAAVVSELLQMETLRHHTVLVSYGELCLLDTLDFHNTGAEAQTFRIEVREQCSMHVCACASVRGVRGLRCWNLALAHWTTVSIGVQIDAPELLRPVATRAELDALQEAIAKRSMRSAANLPEDDVLCGDLLLLQPQETLTLPFSLQTYKSSEECTLPVSQPADEQHEGGAAASLDSVRSVHVRLLNRATGDAVRARHLLNAQPLRCNLIPYVRPC
jgi:hypothetical protein